MITEKKCKCCGVVKPVSEFRARKGASDGYRGEYKACKSAIGKKYREQNSAAIKQKLHEYYLKNKEELNKKNKEYYEKNKERALEQQKDYYSRNKEKIDEYRRKWYLENKERVRESSKQRYLGNREEVLQKSKEWYDSNKEHRLQYLKEYTSKNAAALRIKKAIYRRNNKGKISVLRRKYEQSLKRASPDWLTEELIAEMEDLYTMAQMFKEYTGVEYQVDHIVPIQGGTVCGLNVPWNMQLLPESENKSKGNRHWPDMPETIEQKEQVI